MTLELERILNKLWLELVLELVELQTEAELLLKESLELALSLVFNSF